MFFKKKKETEKKAKAKSGKPSYWRCPNCGRVLEKKEEAAARIKALERLEQLGATIVDLARCSGCGATFDTKDVYSGRYDAEV